jgi:hypothetical protein
MRLNDDDNVASIGLIQEQPIIEGEDEGDEA